MRDEHERRLWSVPIDSAAELEAVCQVANQLIETSDEVSVFLSQALVPVAVFDGPNHRLRFANDAWRDLLGAATVGMTLPEIHAVTPIPAASELDRVFGSGQAAHFYELTAHPLSATDPSTFERFYTGVVHPVRSANGGIRGTMVVCTDVTDDCLAARLLAGRSSLLWSGTPDGVDYISNKLSAYLGRRGLKTSFIHADDHELVSDAVEELGTRFTSETKARLLREDGRWRWHRIRFARFLPRTSNGRFIAAATDFDDEQRAATEIGRASRLASAQKDQFLASISHELRGPITNVLLWEKVLRDDPTPDLRLRALDAIRQSASLQAQLVGDLLDVARAISGKLHLERRAVDLGSVVGAAIEGATPAAQARRVTLVRDLPVALGYCAGDANRLRQVVDNLLSNAVKFTEPSGRVEVRGRREGASIVIDVVDSGRGIEKELLPFVFEPFRQGDPNEAGGLGLGLAIARQLVLAHGGSLVAASEGHGTGSRFTIRLAAIDPDREIEISSPPRLTGVKLLLVDDDPRVCEALQVLLERAGATVETAPSAQVGFVKLEHSVPDVVLSDIAMPGEDGYSFVRKIRSHAGAHQVSTVAITAHVTEADRKRALAAGYDRYVSKPIDVDQLVVMIAKLVAECRP